ncbi:MAG: type II toxin-antitoxin system PemK/MazF family toxin [Myxococcales bacterium]|nr:type II toxin-antitoxin system PemK/MazF family toxin [Myxococcales bacterium]
MRRGEVWWATPRLAGGSPKRRPLLIVSDDVFNCNERYPKVMVVHLTSVQRPGGPFDWEVTVARGVAGIDKASVAKCCEVYTFEKAQLQSVIGTLPRDVMRKIDRALAVALSLSHGPES